MSNAVESEIVSMRFENTQFERGIKTTLGSLDRLKASLNFGDAGSGLSKLSSNIRGFNMNPLTNAAGEVGKAFSSMSVVAISAIATVASKATNAGLGIAKSLSTTPITSGFSEYETQLGSIQTILANTGLEGQSGLDKVNNALNDLNHYSDKTIYNFTEMAKNIGTFTAAGVNLDTSTAAIKGIANLAAVSGSTSEQASTAMYQLSQALSSGKVSLMDWNSVVNAGLGGKVFKDALIDTAKAQGVAVDDMIAKNGSFRDSLQEGWITGEVLTKTLAKFTGDLSKEQLLQQGYTEKQAAEIMKLGQMSSDAATKVKTLSQLMDTLKEAVGSGWSKTFSLIFGDFNQAKKAFTSASNTLGGLIGQSANNRNNMLKDWAKLNGRTSLIQSIKHAWEALGSVLGPVREGFRDIFPETTGKDLKKLTAGINQFFKSLILSETSQENLKRSFAGLFALVDIGLQIFKGFVGVIFDLLGPLGEGAGGVLSFTGGIGDMLVALDNAIKNGTGLKDFFDGLGSVLSVPIELLATVARIIGSIFTGFDSGGAEVVSGSIDRISERLSPIQSLARGFGDALGWIGDKLSSLGGLFAPVIDAFAKFGDSIATGMAGGDFSGVFDVINTVLLGGILVLIKRFFSKGLSIDFGSGVLDGIRDTFGALTDTLTAMQQQIQAKTILMIAGAVALLTASIVALSLIDSASLTKALVAVAVGMGELLLGMKLLSLATSEAGFIKMPLMAASLILLSTSILILSAAVKILSTMSWEELAKGLIAVTALLIGLSLAAKLISGSTGGMVRAGLAMIPLAIAINLLAIAVKVFATMSWQDIAKGLVSIAGALGVIAIAMNAMPKTLPITAAGLVLVTTALAGLAGVMAIFATMSWAEIGKGLAAIGAGLVIIAGAMQLMPASLPITAVGLVLVAAALAGIAGVAKVFATMSWEEMGKAAAALAGALLIIAGGLTLMSGTLLGSAALLIAAAALAVLTPVLVTLGAMSIENLARGLGALAAVFAVLGLAGLALAPVTPILLALSVVMLAIGAGLALAGAAALAFATAFAIFVAAGSAGIAIMTAAILAFIEILPQIVVAAAQAVIDFVVEIGKGAAPMAAAFSSLIVAMINAGIKLIPKFGEFLRTMIIRGIAIVLSLAGRLANAGLTLIVKLLTAIRSHIGDIVDIATDIIIKFINALARNGVKLANAGLQALIDFLNGLAKAIETHSGEINNAGIRVAKAIISGVKDGVSQAAGEIAGAIGSMLSRAASMVNPVNLAKKIKIPGFSRLALDPRVLTGNFANLVGDTEKVTGGLGAIRDQLDDTLKNSKKNVKSLEKQLATLKKAKKKNPEKIEKVQDRLKDARQAAKAAADFGKADRERVKQQSKDLRGLAARYDEVQKKLATWQKTLEDAQAAQAALRDSINSTFNNQPDIQANQTLASYMREISKQQAKVEKFNATLQALRAQGLDDNSYRQFLNEGVDAQRVMDGLLSGGSGAITAFEKANSSLASASATIANNATAQLKDAGGQLTYDQAVTTAQSYIDGLNKGLAGEDSIASLTASMTQIAQVMQSTLKKKLKIHSPSRAAAEIGGFFMRGFTDGVDRLLPTVASSSAAIGETALDTLQTTLSNAGKNLGSDISMTPVITPVLDLTQLAKDASNIDGMLSVSPITAGMSFAQASDIQSNRQASESEDPFEGGGGDTYIDLTQNNTSPKALDDIAIYRQTKSLVALAKEALNK